MCHMCIRGHGSQCRCSYRYWECLFFCGSPMWKCIHHVCCTVRNFWQRSQLTFNISPPHAHGGCCTQGDMAAPVATCITRASRSTLCSRRTTRRHDSQQGLASQPTLINYAKILTNKLLTVYHPLSYPSQTPA